MDLELSVKSGGLERPSGNLVGLAVITRSSKRRERSRGVSERCRGADRKIKRKGTDLDIVTDERGTIKAWLFRGKSALGNESDDGLVWVDQGVCGPTEACWGRGRRCEGGRRGRTSAQLSTLVENVDLPPPRRLAFLAPPTPSSPPPSTTVQSSYHVPCTSAVHLLGPDPTPSTPTHHHPTPSAQRSREPPSRRARGRRIWRHDGRSYTPRPELATAQLDVQRHPRGLSYMANL